MPYGNGYRIRGYIDRGKFFVCFYGPHLFSVHSSSRRGGDEIKMVDGGIVILASCEYHFIRVHENLVQHPSNFISNFEGFIY